MRSDLLRPFGPAAAAVLSVLVIPWWIGRSITEQTRPTTAPATTGAADTIIAEWQYVDGARGYDDPDRPKRERVNDRRPLVRVYSSGRVQMSGDLMLGGGDMTEGKLSPEELERMKSSLRKFINGIEGKDLQFRIMQNYPWHELRVDLGGSETVTLSTSMRLYELEQWADSPSLFSWRKDEMWRPNVDGFTNRYEAALNRPVSFITHRMIWTEIEAEILRAAAQSMLPDVNPRLPVDPHPPAH